jgi:hypothetical protein
MWLRCVATKSFPDHLPHRETDLLLDNLKLSAKNGKAQTEIPGWLNESLHSPVALTIPAQEIAGCQPSPKSDIITLKAPQ